MTQIHFAVRVAIRKALREAHMLFEGQIPVFVDGHETALAAPERLDAAIAEHLLPAIEEVQLKRIETQANQAEMAWHTLRIFLGEHPLDGGQTELIEITHPDVCRTLPAGAACWASNEMLRDWWPSDLGTWRIRPTTHTSGGDEDEPNLVDALDIEPVHTGDHDGEPT